MAQDTTPLPPGSMTVPPLFGWENIALVLLVLVALAVAFFVLLASGTGSLRRSEWQAWLADRSSGTADPAGEPWHPPAEAARDGAAPGRPDVRAVSPQSGRGPGRSERAHG